MNSADDPPVFPYQLIWPGFGNAEITFRELEEFEQQFASMREIALLDGVIREIGRGDIRRLVESLDLPDNEAERLERRAYQITLMLVAAAGRQEDPQSLRSSRAALRRASKAAAKLSEAFSAILPQTLGAMHWMREAEPEVSAAHGLPFQQLGYEARDFALVAERLLADTAADDGRPSEHVRDSAISLVIEALALAGVDDLVVSNANRHEDRRLRGRAGEFIRDLLMPTLALTEPRLADIVGRVRRKRARDQRG